MFHFVDRTVSTESSPNPSLQGAGRSLETSLENFATINNPVLNKKPSISSSTLEIFEDDIPYPSMKLTNERRNNEFDEKKFAISHVDGSYRSSTLKSIMNEGYLNLRCHYLSCPSDKLTNERQKFYCLIRLDEASCARTTLVKRQSDRDSTEHLSNKRPNNKIEYNEQFILDLQGKAFFDVIMCHFIDR